MNLEQNNNPINENNLERERPETPEYRFDEGVKVITSKIIELLEDQSNTVVAVNGSAPNVGKTELMKRLVNDLENQGVTTVATHNIDDILEPEHHTPDKEKKEGLSFIFDQARIGATSVSNLNEEREFYDQKVKDILQRAGYKEIGIDIWIGIYRPDLPFPEQTESGEPAVPIADILIKNSQASNK